MHCSFHPHHIKSSIVYSQLLRLKRICSDISDYEHEVKILTQSLLSRGYPYKLFSEQINHASHIVRTKSLIRNSNKNTNEKRITFITQFHPSIATFLKNVNKEWLNIRTDNHINNKLSNPIILANKQPRNLQQLNTRLRTHFYNVTNHVTNHDVMFAHILMSDAASNLTIMSQSLLPKLSVTHRTWSTSYFVLSARTLLMSVKLPTVFDLDPTITNTALSTIFLDTPQLCTSAIEDLRCMIIKNHVPNMDNRKIIEQKTIMKLNTHITGLNNDRIFLSHYDLYVVCTCLLNARPN